MISIKRFLCLTAALGILFCSSAFAATIDTPYILGDTDGDGRVTISDATKVQKIIAGILPDPDGTMSIRGNVNGGNLTISDASQIQRYVVHFDNIYNIGSTVQPTTKPRDPYELPFIPV